MSDSLQSHRLQHARLLCPPLSPGVCSNSCSLSRWCYLTILSSAVLFSFCLQCFPASGAFPMNQLCVSGGQSTGASASVFPMNIQGWFPRELTGLTSLKSKGLLRVLQHHNSKASILWRSAFMIQLIHPYITTGKTIALTGWTFVGKVIGLLFSTLSRFVIAFLPRSKCLLISWLHSPSAMILDPKKIKLVTISTFFPSVSHEVIGLDVWT